MASVAGCEMPWLDRSVCQATIVKWSLWGKECAGSTPAELAHWEEVQQNESLDIVELAPRDAATQRPQSWRAHKFGGPLAIVRPRDPWANWAAPTRSSASQTHTSEIYTPRVGDLYTTRSEWAPVSNEVQTEVSNSMSLAFSHESIEGYKDGSVVSLAEGFSVGDWMSSSSQAYPSRASSVAEASEVVLPFGPTPRA